MSDVLKYLEREGVEAIVSQLPPITFGNVFKGLGIAVSYHFPANGYRWILKPYGRLSRILSWSGSSTICISIRCENFLDLDFGPFRGYHGTTRTSKAESLGASGNSMTSMDRWCALPLTSCRTLRLRLGRRSMVNAARSSRRLSTDEALHLRASMDVLR